MQHCTDAPKAREALKLLLSPEGQFFREFITNEVVLSIDAMSRAQLAALVARLGLAGINLPVLLPGASRRWCASTPIHSCYLLLALASVTLSSGQHQACSVEDRGLSGASQQALDQGLKRGYPR